MTNGSLFPKRQTHIICACAIRIILFIETGIPAGCLVREKYEVKNMSKNETDFDVKSESVGINNKSPEKEEAQLPGSETRGKNFDQNGDLVITVDSDLIVGYDSPPPNEDGEYRSDNIDQDVEEYFDKISSSRKEPRVRRDEYRDSNILDELYEMIDRKKPQVIGAEPNMKAFIPRRFKSPSEYAFFITRALLERHVIRASQGSLYLYDAKRGYFKPLSFLECKTLIREGWGEEISKRLSRSVVSDIIERIITEPSIQMEPGKFDSYPYLMNFQDVVVDLKEGKVAEHSPDYGFTSYIRADYKPKNTSDGKKFRAFIKTCMQGDEAKEKHLQEIVGYMLSNYHKAKVAPFLVGVPNSGKSALIHLITELIGSEHVSNLPLHKLHGKFALAQLSKKKLNVCSELGGSPLSNLDVFKAITGNDRMDAEFKFQDNFSFHSKVKLMFAGNSMPPLKEIDKTTAFFDRLTFVCFSYTVPPDDRDHQLVKKLMQRETDYIVAWAVEGIVRLKKNRFCFSECPESVEFKRRYIAEQNSADDFIKDACEFGNGESHKIHKRDLLEAYEAHCRDNCLVRLRNAEFFAEIEKRVGRPDRFRMNGQSLWGYKGIKLVQ